MRTVEREPGLGFTQTVSLLLLELVMTGQSVLVLYMYSMGIDTYTAFRAISMKMILKLN